MNDIDAKILEKLDTLVKLTVLNTIKDKEYKDQVELLSSIGFQPKEIADMLGKTSNSVRVTLSNLRKDKKTKKEKKVK